jgi:uncharacterized protein
VSSVPPSPYEHPGSPPARPELPEGVHRDPLPEAEPTKDALPDWPVWAPFAGMLVTVIIALVGITLIAGIVSAGGLDVDPDAQPPGVTIAGTLIQDLGLIVSALLLAHLTGGRPTTRQFGLRVPRLWPAIGWLLLAWGVFLLFSAIWAAALNITESDDLPQELGADESSTALAAVAVLVCFVAPITEEFFFRGFCFTALRRAWGVIPAALATGVIFGAIHAGGTQVEFLGPLACFGLMLCLLYYWTESLIPCMILHALNNSLALGVSQDWTWQIPVLMLAAVVAVLAVMLPVARSPRLNAAAA